MIAAVVLGAWVAACVVAAALCAAGGRADRVTESWARERASARDALDSLGADADGLWS